MTSRNTLQIALLLSAATCCCLVRGGAPEVASQPAARPRQGAAKSRSQPRPVRTLKDIALADEDLEAVGMTRASEAPEPRWARPFHTSWFITASASEVLALKDTKTGGTHYYGLALYPSRWLAEAALDEYRSSSNMWAPIGAWSGTGDRCWGGGRCQGERDYLRGSRRPRTCWANRWRPGQAHRRCTENAGGDPCGPQR